MYIDFAADWPAYVFMVAFIAFFIFVVIKGNATEEDIVESKEKEATDKK